MFDDNSDSESSDEREEQNPEKRTYKFRDRIDWQKNLSIAEFKERFANIFSVQYLIRFRMTPIQCELLLNRIGAEIAPKASTNHAISAKGRLLAALRFYATGSMYFSVGDAEHLSKWSIWMCIHKVTNALNKIDNIKYPQEEHLLRRIPIEFYRISGKNGNLPGKFG